MRKGGNQKMSKVINLGLVEGRHEMPVAADVFKEGIL